MTCARHYTPAAVADLQQIAATIEAERRRQYRAEMAQELRQISQLYRETITDPALYDQDHWVVTARLSMLGRFAQWIDRLSPPVVCDSN